MVDNVRGVVNNTQYYQPKNPCKECHERYLTRVLFIHTTRITTREVLFMAIARIHKTRDYTVMSNSHFREKEMSLKAKGLLSLMLSLPDDWDYSIAGLCTLSKDGKDSVMNALNELEDFGYLIRTRNINEKGQFSGYDYDIYEIPQTDKPKTENPYAENPNTDNPLQLNTNQSSIKKSIKKELNTNEYIFIVEYLNSQAKTKFKASSKATQQHIHARLEEGFTVEDFKTVIDKKCADWIGTEFEQYLRPTTLFGTKFESYLNAVSNKKNYGKTGVEVKKPAVDDLAGIL